MKDQILYDKEIKVTLYKPERVTVARYKVHAIDGYKTAQVSGQKVIYATSSAQAKDWDVPLEGQNPSTSWIEFYEGDTRKVFMGYRTTSTGKQVAVYKVLSAAGARYDVATIEEMKLGVRPDGQPYSTGDKVRVKEDGSTWNVYRQGSVNSLYQEDPTEIREEAITLTIGAPNSGLKPDIGLTINLLPGQNCYGAVLKIRNLNLDAINIRDWTRMVIEAGYRTGAHAKYTCPIFTSYIESPNPDGVTVFEGITVGVAENVFDTQPIEISFVQKEMTLEELIRGVAPAIADNIPVNIYLDDSIAKNEKIQVQKQTVYAQNGAAVLNWLQGTVAQFVQEMTRGKTSAFVQFVNGELDVIAINGPNKNTDNVENIISLDMISGATFNGTALTVEAPWNPALQPGDLFFMPPEFINGSKLPNVLPESDYRNEDNLYRAITIGVSFATVENVNKMTILAVPAQWAGEMPSNMTTEMTGADFAAVMDNEIKSQGARNVQVGKMDQQDLEAVTNVSQHAKKTNNEMFDKFDNILTQWDNWIEIRIDETKGNCLSKILEYYFITDDKGPHLVYGAKGKGNEYCYFIDRKTFMDEGNDKALEYFQNNGCWANLLWWPLTVVGTYWRKWKDDENHMSNNWSRVDLLNPDKIEANKVLYIPAFPGSWESAKSKLQNIKDIWKYAYQKYKEIYPASLYRTWRAMYYYMGGTDELD